MPLDFLGCLSLLLHCQKPLFSFGQLISLLLQPHQLGLICCLGRDSSRVWFWELLSLGEQVGRVQLLVKGWRSPLAGISSSPLHPCEHLWFLSRAKHKQWAPIVVLSRRFNRNNERNERAQVYKLKQMPKEDKTLYVNSGILKSRSPLQVPVGLLL
jgi:hypothetical protein